MRNKMTVRDLLAKKTRADEVAPEVVEVEEVETDVPEKKAGKKSVTVAPATGEGLGD